jgi:DNA-binding beta-propeller fold protein YncE
MWVANNGSNTVSKLSLNGKIQDTFAVGNQPFGITFDGANIWVANFASSNVTKLSLKGKTLGTFAVEASP